MSILFTLLLSLTMVASPEDSSASIETSEDSARAKRQATRVMNAGLEFVERALYTEREFPPFGAVMLPTGKIQTLGTADMPADVSLEEIYAQLIDGLRDGASSGSYRAVATFALVELRHPEDDRIINAVHVALEHQDGYCVNVYYPTVVEGETLVLGEAFAGRRIGKFFESCNHSPQG